MDNFDLKKYLAEGRLLKEEIMVDTTIMMGGDEYLNGMFSNPEEYGIEEDEIEFVKNVISTPKMPASKFLDVFDDYWVNIIQEPGGDSQHIEQGLEDHVKGGMLSPEEAAQVMIMYWDPDGTDYGDEEKEDTLKHFQNLAEGKLLKEAVMWNWSGDRNELEEVPPKFKAAVKAVIGDKLDNDTFEEAFDGIKNFHADEAGEGEQTFNSDHWAEQIEMDYL